MKAKYRAVTERYFSADVKGTGSQFFAFDLIKPENNDSLPQEKKQQQQQKKHKKFKAKIINHKRTRMV